MSRPEQQPETAAAAPELLAALKLAKRYIEHGKLSLVQVSDAYNTAIAAATGEKS